jgi:hypothetical protein
MTYAAHHTFFASGGKASMKREANANKRGLLRGIFNIILQSSRKQTDRKIASFIASRGGGGRVTDNLEREMMHHLLSSWY